MVKRVVLDFSFMNITLRTTQDNQEQQHSKNIEYSPSTSSSIQAPSSAILQNQNSPGIKKLFSCPHVSCAKTFLYQSELSRHIQTHSSTRPFMCPYSACGKGFKRFDTLQTHFRLHTGEKPFICENPSCGLTFSTKAGLRYHSLKHKNDKYFKCEVPDCNKSFLTLGQLKQHERGKCHGILTSTQDDLTKDVPSSLMRGVKSEPTNKIPQLILFNLQALPLRPPLDMAQITGQMNPKRVKIATEK